MNCSTFKSKLNDYIEGNISYDLKDAMLQHTTECEVCKKIEESELLIEKNFRKAIKNDEITFNSSRSDIIRSIDKKRYSKSFINKLYYHTKRFKALYAVSAVILMCSIFLMDYAKPYYWKETSSKSTDILYEHKDSTLAQKEEKKEIVNTVENIPKVNEQPISSKTEAVQSVNNDKKEKIYIPSFTKKNVDSNFQVDVKKNSTTFKESANKKYKASIIGKGAQAQEEGVGKVYIEDLNSGEKWSLELVQDNRKNTPKDIEWLDDENMLVIVGEAYGTITRGGKLYLLNSKTMKVCEVDATNQAKLDEKGMGEIVSVLSVKENSIEILVNIYDDDNFINSHSEKRIISISLADLKNKVI